LPVTLHRGRRRDHRIELHPVARVIADHVRRRGDDCGCQVQRRARGTKAFRRWRAGIGPYRQQVRHRVRRGRKLQIGCVDNLGDQRAAASNLDGLSTMMGLIATGASGLSHLRAA
jgi:hypothetical protein